MNPRILAVVLDGHEAAMVAGMPTLVALARAREATVRVAYFRPIPDPRVDRYDRVVADSDREMTRIGRGFIDTLRWAAQRFDGVVMHAVVRFGAPRREVDTEVEVFRPSIIALFAPRAGGPLARLRAWVIRRRVTRSASTRVLVLETPPRSETARDGRRRVVVAERLSP